MQCGKKGREAAGFSSGRGGFRTRPPSAPLVGTIVQQTWDDLPTHYSGINLDAFIVMPNHVHGIIILADESERRHAIPEIVRGFKTFSARRVNERGGRRGALWQRGYYEHNNPARWADDPDNL